MYPNGLAMWLVLQLTILIILLVASQAMLAAPQTCLDAFSVAAQTLSKPEETAIAELFKKTALSWRNYCLL
jgi:hypothetical protein